MSDEKSESETPKIIRMRPGVPGNADGYSDLCYEGGGPVFTAPLYHVSLCLDFSEKDHWGLWLMEFLCEAKIVRLPHRGHLKIPRTITET